MNKPTNVVPIRYDPELDSDDLPFNLALHEHLAELGGYQYARDNDPNETFDMYMSKDELVFVDDMGYVILCLQGDDPTGDVTNKLPTRKQVEKILQDALEHCPLMRRRKGWDHVAELKRMRESNIKSGRAGKLSAKQKRDEKNYRDGFDAGVLQVLMYMGVIHPAELGSPTNIDKQRKNMN